MTSLKKTPRNPASANSARLSKQIQGLGRRLWAAAPHWEIWLIAFLATAHVARFIDAGGAYPQLEAGPGLTLDESFNVQQGVYLVQALWQYGPLILFPESVRDVFGADSFMSDHPPLGRFWLGLHHEAVVSLWPSALADERIVITAGRFGSATAFGLTVFLVGALADRWSSRPAGIIAALALFGMPIAHGHAHLAALETVTSLTWLLAVIALSTALEHKHPPSFRLAAIVGFAWGLALLTKIQGVLLAPVLVGTLLLTWRTSAILPAGVVSGAALTTFFVGWPWLWLNPVAHAKEFFLSSTDRVSLNVFYQGTVFADRDVPWHYPLVEWCVTTPVLFLILGFAGLALAVRAAVQTPPPRSVSFVNDVPPAELDRRRAMLLLFSIAIPLIVFSLPKIAVYDGTRLFLVIAPFWAIACGWALPWFSTVPRPIRIGLTALAISAMFATGDFRAVQPAPLSYYNALVGSTSGAIDRGFEANVWGDALNRDLWNRVAAELPFDAEVALVPTMHQFQTSDLMSEVAAIRRRRLKLIAYDPLRPPRYVVCFHRRADLAEPWRTSMLSVSPPPSLRLVAEVVDPAASFFAGSIARRHRLAACFERLDAVADDPNPAP